VRGYLLDTNHVSAWANKHPQFLHRLRDVPPETPIRACAISIGELEWGHRTTKTTDLEARARAMRFITQEIYPHASLDITLRTRTYYADILERIWLKHPPNIGRPTEGHLARLGVDINDVWTVASAWEHGLTFLTTDNMSAIRQSAPEVVFDSWLP
jgi:predicted nucleic acid-binding protein